MLDSVDKAQADALEAEVDDLIRLVGARVRFFRKNSGFSRRVLSERSGVSTRYLAQLEGGTGNVSIGLLKRISIALETPVEALIAAAPETAAEGMRVASLFLNADMVTQARALNVLDPKHQRAEKAQRVCLIGLRGAGKSTLGEQVGRDLGVPFIELNKEVERSAGIPASEIFSLYSDEGYRQLEADELARVITENSRAVLAVGGGIVSDKRTFATVISKFHTVWIKAQPDEHMSRVRSQGDLRPMAGNPQAMRQLHEILKGREAEYAQADFQLDTSGKSLEASLADLKGLLLANIFARPETA